MGSSEGDYVGCVHEVFAVEGECVGRTGDTDDMDLADYRGFVFW